MQMFVYKFRGKNYILFNPPLQVRGLRDLKPRCFSVGSNRGQCFCRPSPRPRPFAQRLVYGPPASAQPAALWWKCRLATVAVVLALGPAGASHSGQASSPPWRELHIRKAHFSLCLLRAPSAYLTDCELATKLLVVWVCWVSSYAAPYLLFPGSSWKLQH